MSLSYAISLLSTNINLLSFELIAFTETPSNNSMLLSLYHCFGDIKNSLFGISVVK